MTIRVSRTIGWSHANLQQHCCASQCDQPQRVPMAPSLPRVVSAAHRCLIVNSRHTRISVVPMMDYTDGAALS
jgi:hypothetical protein